MSGRDARCDAIVVGLGAMGSAAAYHLARRGTRVLALDRFTPPHAHGSTHGRSRIIREAYYEHPCYVPLVRRAYENWAALEREAGRPLLRRTGGLMIGPPDGLLVAGARRSAMEHGLAYEELSPSEARRRFPGVALEEDMVALHEPRAGVLFPEACIESHLALARRYGADVHLDERVLGWRADGDGVLVETEHAAYRASHLVLSVGPWLPTLVPELELPLQIERQLFHWFAPRAHAEWYAPDRCPIAMFEYAPDRLCYSLPDLGDGVKLGIHHEGRSVSADARREPATAEEIARARALVERFLPDAAGPLMDSATCLYTNTPDHDFIIDRHPEHSRVLIASPCSGHGFKFASAIGELLAELVTTGETGFDLGPFRLSRFRTAA